MANIANLRANVEVQRAYMWEVFINGLSTGALDGLDAFAKTVSLPQTSVEQLVVNHKAGRTHYAGRDASGHTVTVTFWDDESLSVYRYFSDWMNLIHDQKTASSAPRSDTTADMAIKLKNSSDDAVTGTIKLTKVFPTELADVSLSYDNSDAMEVSVTFSFDERHVE